MRTRGNRIRIYKLKMFIRNCPECHEKIKYKNERSFKNAESKGTLCFSCVKKGNKNNFFEKHHTKESKFLMGVKNRGKTYEELYGDKANDIRGKVGLKGEKNPLYGTSNYQIWIKKYGEEKALVLLKNSKEKTSIKSSGKNNPMYGKPAPTGSGNGWSGWYKGWYFRSLKELSFMLYYIERFNLKWERGEKYRIKYKDENRERNYFADFIINEKYLVEIKPINLWNSKYVQLKKEAAEEFCKQKKLKYKLIDPIKIISKKELEKIIEKGELKLLERYQIKLKNYVA